MKSTKEEAVQIITAINEINKHQHVKYMPYDMLANTSGMKESRVRLVLQQLCEDNLLIRVPVSKRQVPRYIYAITDEGKEFYATFQSGSGTSEILKTV